MERLGVTVRTGLRRAAAALRRNRLDDDLRDEVELHIELRRQALVDDDVDVLFGNEAELVALYEVSGLDAAIDEVRRRCELVAVTTGKEGSRIVTVDDIVHVPAEPVARVLDTTGAGDLYAAGFLFGLTRDLPLAECGRIGSVAAAEVISHVGPRPLVELKTLI